MQFPPQQYGISQFPGMQPSNQNNMPVIPQMAQTHPHSQQSHPNYLIHGQQPQWIHHQSPHQVNIHQIIVRRTLIILRIIK
jgi:hypothetical protein